MSFLINVAYSVADPATWEREVTGLTTAKAGPEHAERVLVAHERTGRKPPVGNQVVDAWRYLLGEARA